MNQNSIRSNSIFSRMKNGSRLLVTSTLFGALATSTFAADWQALERSSDQKIGFSVNLGKKANQTVTVTVPGYYIDTVDVDGETYSQVRIPGFPSLNEAGNPDLPKISTNFVVAPGQAPSVRVVSDDFVDIKLDHPLVSSKGHFTRDISPEDVPHTFSKIYEMDTYYPATTLATVSEPFIFHNVSGVNLDLNFFQYNPVSQTLRVHKSVVLELDDSAPKNKRAQKTLVPNFVADALKSSFINYSVVKEPMAMERVAEDGRMIVICHDDFMAEIEAFVQWKRKSGIPTDLVKLSDVGSSAEDIKAYVQAEFDKGGLSYLHLVGDVEQIPTLRGTVERAHSDQSYGLLAGDDWFLDIIVSRFSAKTADKVAYQVAKTIRYEAYPDSGDAAAWYKKGMGIASNEGSPKDWDYADTIREGLMEFTYDEIDQIYDPGASASSVAAGVNAGRSVINYIGHGSKTSWATSRFNTGDIKDLTNGTSMPYIWSVACVNGAFAGYGESFAEAWLNAGDTSNYKGAVVIAAASTNMQWVPPLYWQAEANLVRMVQGLDKSFGGLSIGGMAKIAEKYGPTHRSFKMFVEQTNNFGDGSVRVRYDVPTALEVSNVRVEDGKLLANVKGGEDLNVTVYNSGTDLLMMGQPNERGEVTVDLQGANVEELAMTITGTNVVPVVDMPIARSAKSGKSFDELHD